MTRFIRNIERFIAKTKIAPNKVLRKLGLDALKGLMLRSPVDTGRYRASHRLGVNRVDTSSEPPFAGKTGQKKGAPPTRGETEEARQALQTAAFGDTIHLSNSLPYAKPIEEGHSKQAPGPGAVYDLTFQDLRDKFDRAVRSIKGGGDDGVS